MKNKFLLILWSCTQLISAAQENPVVIKKVLDNGLTVLLVPRPLTPHVAVQLYYNVGSKDEDTHEKGIAHLLEHMVFKGTKELLSETDISLVTHTLSGYCNAMTSHDYTGYVFSLPTRYWHEALPILADCMTNCTFKQDLLNAEFKAVIQELKMNRDNYDRALVQEIITAMFPDHPYHYPVIGFKHDIWDVKSEDLMKFYKKYYAPNNAVLIVVGDIQPDAALTFIKQHFDGLPAQPLQKRHRVHHTRDLCTKAISLPRDIQNPRIILAYPIPGLNKKPGIAVETLTRILTGDITARLHTKIVEQQRAYAIQSYHIPLSEEGIFFIDVVLKSERDIPAVTKIITDELTDIAQHGPTKEEIENILNAIKSTYADHMEQNDNIAHDLGKAYMATGDEHYPFTILKKDPAELSQEIKDLVQQHCRTAYMHSGVISPISAEDKIIWQELQQQSDAEDAAILQERVRTSNVEEPRYAHNLQTTPLELKAIPMPKERILDNGLTVISYHNPLSEKTICSIYLKADRDYEEIYKPGLYELMTATMIRGTHQHTYQEIGKLTLKNAAGIALQPGTLTASMFNKDCKETFNLLVEIMTQPLFDEAELQKARDQITATIQKSWDTPTAIATYLFQCAVNNERLYLCPEHIDSINNSTREDILACYKTCITPRQAYAVIVGNIEDADLEKIINATLGTWQGEPLEDQERPVYRSVKGSEIHYPMNRDQTILMLGTQSVARNHPDFYALNIASVILSGSMSSKLFNLREKTGLFYTAQGSFVAHADKYPGFFYIQATVSPENVTRVKELLHETIEHFADTITDEEVESAKNLFLNNTASMYATNRDIHATLSFLKKFGLPWNFIEQRVEIIQKITADDIRRAVRTLLADKEFIHVEVGR